MGILFTANGYFQSNASAMPAINSAKSICFRLISSNLSATPQSVINLINLQLSSGCQIGFRSGRLSVWAFGGSEIVSAEIPLNVRHIAYTFTGSTHLVYVDGVLRTTSATAPQTGPTLLCQVGSNQWSEYLRSTEIEDLRVYSRSLSDHEVRTIANAFSMDGIVHGLVANFPCTDASNFIDYYGSTSQLIGAAPSTTPSRILIRP